MVRAEPGTVCVYTGRYSDFYSVRFLLGNLSTRTCFYISYNDRGDTCVDYDLTFDEVGGWEIYT